MEIEPPAVEVALEPPSPTKLSSRTTVNEAVKRATNDRMRTKKLHTINNRLEELMSSIDETLTANGAHIPQKVQWRKSSPRKVVSHVAHASLHQPAPVSRSRASSLTPSLQVSELSSAVGEAKRADHQASQFPKPSSVPLNRSPNLSTNVSTNRSASSSSTPPLNSLTASFANPINVSSSQQSYSIPAASTSVRTHHLHVTPQPHVSPRKSPQRALRHAPPPPTIVIGERLPDQALNEPHTPTQSTLVEVEQAFRSPTGHLLSPAPPQGTGVIGANGETPIVGSTVKSPHHRNMVDEQRDVLQSPYAPHQSSLFITSGTALNHSHNTPPPTPHKARDEERQAIRRELHRQVNHQNEIDRELVRQQIVRSSLNSSKDHPLGAPTLPASPQHQTSLIQNNSNDSVAADPVMHHSSEVIKMATAKLKELEERRRVLRGASSTVDGASSASGDGSAQPVGGGSPQAVNPAAANKNISPSPKREESSLSPAGTATLAVSADRGVSAASVATLRITADASTQMTPPPPQPQPIEEVEHHTLPESSVPIVERGTDAAIPKIQQQPPLQRQQPQPWPMPQQQRTTPNQQPQPQRQQVLPSVQQLPPWSQRSSSPASNQQQQPPQYGKQPMNKSIPPQHLMGPHAKMPRFGTPNQRSGSTPTTPIRQAHHSSGPPGGRFQVSPHMRSRTARPQHSDPHAHAQHKKPVAPLKRPPPLQQPPRSLSRSATPTNSPMVPAHSTLTDRQLATRKRAADFVKAMIQRGVEATVLVEPGKYVRCYVRYADTTMSPRHREGSPSPPLLSRMKLLLQSVGPNGESGRPEQVFDFSQVGLSSIAVPFATSVRPKWGIASGVDIRRDMRKRGYEPKMLPSVARTVALYLTNGTMIVLTFPNRVGFVVFLVSMHALKWPNTPLSRGAALWLLCRHLVLSRLRLTRVSMSLRNKPVPTAPAQYGRYQQPIGWQ